jgi:histidine triad (HIT) family protein
LTAAKVAAIQNENPRGETMAEYDNNNIFAKILRGELPAQKVYEDEHTLAFLDIMPRAPGHTLIIPKKPARNLLDVDPESLAHVVKTAKKIAIAGKKAFNADGVTMQQFNETAGGQVVFHLHVHIIPRHKGVPMKPAASQMEKPEILAEHAKLLKASLG